MYQIANESSKAWNRRQNRAPSLRTGMHNTLWWDERSESQAAQSSNKCTGYAASSDSNTELLTASHSALPPLQSPLPRKMQKATNGESGQKPKLLLPLPSSTSFS